MNNHMSGLEVVGVRSETQVAEIGVRLIDDAYVAWVGAECDCEHALRAWLDAPPHREGEMYFGFRAALDREEAAARDLERLCEVAPACRERLARRGRAVLD
jgi:hypothetical protein